MQVLLEIAKCNLQPDTCSCTNHGLFPMSTSNYLFLFCIASRPDASSCSLARCLYPVVYRWRASSLTFSSLWKSMCSSVSRQACTCVTAQRRSTRPSSRDSLARAPSPNSNSLRTGTLVVHSMKHPGPGFHTGGGLEFSPPSHNFPPSQKS